MFGKIVFVCLLVLIIFTAIPYGTADAWWKAFFVSAVFTLSILWLVEGWLSRNWFDGVTECRWVILPVLALALFSFLQTWPLGNTTSAAIAHRTWNEISADPYQTRFFVLQLLSLTLAGVLLLRYVSTERRLRSVINVVIAVGVASAIFGILRQTTQHSPGFGLPVIAPGQGYGQFVNRNHFAFLMEMALGLALGLVLGGGVKRDKAMIYLAALLPLWTALVLCGSRGGLIAMLAQVIAAILLFRGAQRQESSAPASNALRFMRSRAVRWVMLVVLLCSVAFGTLWLGGDQLASRLETTSSEFATDNESRQGVKRNEVWSTTWKMFKANPILGVGLGAYWVRVPEYHDASGSMTPQEAHNDYLELLASGGLVGLAIGAWFAVGLWRAVEANLRSAHRFRRAACYGAAIGIAGVGVHSLVDFGLHMLANAIMFTTLVAIAASKPRWANETAENHA